MGKYTKGQDWLIHEYFEARALEYPDKTALLFGSEQMTYTEVNQKANQLARFLKRSGAVPGGIIGIIAVRSCHMVIGMLGVLKAGCAYLPIEINFPKQRVDYILRDSECNILLTTGDMASELDYSGTVIDMEQFPYHGEKDTNLLRTEDSDSLAYILYTSGTTGNPKGVMVGHKSVVNLLKFMEKTYPLGDEDVYLFKTNYTFDVSVSELYGWFMGTGSLAILEESGHLDIGSLEDAIEKYHVTHINFVPSMLHMFIKNCNAGKVKSLKYLFAAGEELTPNTVSDFYGKFQGIRLENLYGPTESTVYATYYSVRMDNPVSPVPIGKPIDNLQVYIVDDNNNRMPDGTAGELCIAGAGLAKGYLNRPELNREKFVDNPFEAGSKMYKTGDLARWTDKGTIEFLGRIDSQVKIRGLRVELGEIESRLVEHEKIEEAVVAVKNYKGQEQYLCAYIVGKEVSELSDYLKRYLPEYMIPSYYIPIKEIPRTASQKIDRKSLPEPDWVIKNRNYKAPTTDTEKRLIMLWQEILGIEEIGINDNFFDLGGHSLKAVDLTSRIHKEFSRKISLKQLFVTPTVKQLAFIMDSKEESKLASIRKIPKREYYETSSAQKRMLVMQELNQDNTSYNMFQAVRIKGQLDIERLKSAFAQLIRRHEALRTAFIMLDGVYVQKVYDELPVELIQLTAREENLKECIENSITSFELGKAPLMKASLFMLGEKDYALALNIHHIISDGTSMGLLIQELMQLYKGKKLPYLRIQYKDFTVWQNQYSLSQEVKKQKEYWLGKFNRSNIPFLNLPTDYRRPAIQSFRGEKLFFHIEDDLTERLHKISREKNTTMYTTLLAAYQVLLFRYTGQNDIIVGTSVAGRKHPDLQGILGMLVNALPIRNYPEGFKSFSDFLDEVKTNTLEAYENDEYQFEDLVDALNLQRNLSSNPLFNTMFDLQNMYMPELDLEGLEIKPLNYEEGIARFDLEFNITEQKDGLFFTLQYSTELFRRSTIERLVLHYKNILKQIVDYPERLLCEFDVITPQEEEQILFDFNHTERFFPKDTAYTELFELQAARTPMATAAVDEGNSVTYAELKVDADKVAGYLINKYNMEHGALVGIMLDRSIYMLTSILGIFKAGGAYIPIDPNYPEERIRTMIDDAGIKILIGEKKYIRALNRLQWSCKSLSTITCIDSWNVNGEAEHEQLETMDRKLWQYIGNTATDEITSGGWNSSYTGKPFTKQEMDEYGDNALHKLLPLLDKDKKVMEIGCASGITMYRLAPHVSFYYGTDLSDVIIQKNREYVKQEGISNIKLETLSLDELYKASEKDFDLVVINSVIQDFNGHNYLRKGIKNVIERMNAQGHIFIGDVMDQERKTELITDLNQFKREHAGEKKYRTKTDWSSELFVARGFFEDLKAEIPEVAEVIFTEKKYTIENELTKFRYDVLIRIDKEGIDENKSEIKNKYQHDRSDIDCYSGIAIDSRSKPDDIAYVIYTSGSTGKPKGAMVEQVGVVNHLFAKINDLNITKRTIICQNASHCFDISVWQFLSALIVGGHVVIYPNSLILNQEAFVEALNRDNVNILEVVPSYLAVMLEQMRSKNKRLPALDYLLVTGEELKAQLVKEWLEDYPLIPIVNAYGPTEASDDITHNFIREVPADEIISIGTPLQNFKIYIVDDNFKLCPIGVKGEIVVSGIGVGRGYLGDPKKTAGVFMEDMFRPKEKIRLYKTGDIGAWNYDGTIMFYGRKDYQVKIRGFRIELGEIERSLLAQQAIEEAVVIDREDSSGNKQLYAYYVSKNGEEIPNIRELLAEELPDYMIPAYFMRLDVLPLNVNGKIDRKVLPNNGFTVSVSKEYIEPSDIIETKIQQIWAEVLGMEAHAISMDSDFFELGGHSLKIIRLIAIIHKNLDVEITIADAFSHPTIKDMADYVRTAGKDYLNSIKPIPKAESYSLSSAQKRIFMLHQLDPEGTMYNMPGAVTLEGEVNIERLKEAFCILIERHEGLRTVFYIKGQEPVQEVKENIVLDIGIHHAGEDEVASLLAEFIKPFDLSKGPLFRINLIKVCNLKYVLFFDFHHIIADGVSEGILMKEFMQLYNGEKLNTPKVQYKDFAAWHNERKSLAVMERQKLYWLSEYLDELPVLELPLDYRRPRIKRFRGSMISFELNEHQVLCLKEIAKESAATLYMLFMSIFQIFVSKLSGQEDIVVGTPIAGRNHADVDQMIGMFVNTLALRAKPQGEKSFLTFLQEVKQKTVNAFSNQDYQFEDLVEQLAPERDTGRNPLFDIMFMFQNMDIPVMEISELKLKQYDFVTDTAKFDLTLSVQEMDGKLQLSFEYSTELFKRESIVQFIEYFLQLVKQVIADPTQHISEIELLKEEKKEWLINKCNETVTELVCSNSLIEMFGLQVNKTPNRAAVSSGNEELTYYELNKEANKIAKTLKDRGVQRNQLIAIMMNRSINFIVAVFGVLKAGAAYLPIDPIYPDSRKTFLLEDSKAGVLLIDNPTEAVYSEFLQSQPDTDILNVSELRIQRDGEGDIKVANQPDDLCYIIYTSGTTGKPKGVLVEHKGVMNYIQWAAKTYVKEEQADFPLFTSISFDLTVTSIFTPLVTGNKVVVYQDQEHDILIQKIIEDNKVDIIKLTPSHLKIVKEQTRINSRIKRLIVGGEELEVQLATEVQSAFVQDVEIYNEYGPTETVVGCMIHKFSARDDRCMEVPIGVPIDNMKTYILDRYHHITPFGVIGELYIGGIGVARGYLNHLELTKERFIENPFKKGEKIYRTGDLAKYLPDGTVYFLGRNDDQVKIRGYRIELGEIEQQILKQEQVKNAAVVVRTTESGDKYLDAYYTSDEEDKSEHIKYDLLKNLPDYMIPAHIVKIDSIPLTSNGKLDYKQLPIINNLQGSGFILPRNNTEEELLIIWSELLSINREEISTDANFFELGGHSLMASIMVLRIHKMLGKKVPLAEVFHQQTIQKLADYLKQSETAEYQTIQKAKKKEFYRVSSVQRRIFFLQKLNVLNLSYNTPKAVILEGKLDLDRFQSAIKEIIKRHESLRTVFAYKNEEPVQIILPETEFNIEFFDASIEAEDSVIDKFIRPFDLGRAPLMRIGLMRQEEAKWLLLMDMHHIITDGRSDNIFLDEFVKFYGGQRLPELRIQYKDYSEWQYEEARFEEMRKQELFWLKQFSKKIPTLNLPLDFNRPTLNNFEGSNYYFELNEETTRALKEMALEQDVTLFMLLLSIYQILLSKLSGQEDIVVGTSIEGRRHADLEPIIGMFVNTLALRNQPKDSLEYREFLKNVRNSTLEAFDNQDYLLEQLVEKVVEKHDAGRNPLFDVMFVLNNEDKEIETLDDLKISPYKLEAKGAQLDIKLRAHEANNRLQCVFEYSTSLFKEETMKEFSEHYIKIMNTVLIDPNIHLSDIKIDYGYDQIIPEDIFGNGDFSF